VTDRPYDVSVDKHLKYSGYRFCADNSIVNDFYNNTIYGKIKGMCSQLIPEFCRYIPLQINVLKVKSNLSYTQINLIPNHYIEPQITEQLAMDYNDLIYNIGGTVGMWMGLSMLGFFDTVFMYTSRILSRVTRCTLLDCTVHYFKSLYTIVLF